MKGIIIKVALGLGLLLFIGMSISLPSGEDAVANPTGIVTLSVQGPPDLGMMLKTKEVEIKADDKVLDVLVRVAGREEIQLEYRGSGAGAYVEGIANIYEFDRGPESGWMYKVNGSFPNRSAGNWPVNPGDHLEWVYTKDLGKDVGADPDGKQWNGEDH